MNPRREFLKRTAALFVFSSLNGFSMLLMGCGMGAAAWIGLALNLVAAALPTIEPIIAGFLALIGKTLTAAQAAKIQAVFQAVSQQFLIIQADLQKISSDPTIIAAIKDAIAAAQADLQQLLATIGISDPATLTKITDIVNGFLDELTAILNYLPVLTGGKLMAARPPAGARKPIDAEAWKRDMRRRVTQPTGNAAVDGVFGKIDLK